MYFNALFHTYIISKKFYISEPFWFKVKQYYFQNDSFPKIS